MKHNEVAGPEETFDAWHSSMQAERIARWWNRDCRHAFLGSANKTGCQERGREERRTWMGVDVLRGEREGRLR